MYYYRYVSLGHVAHVGEGQPERTVAMCIRADAADTIDPSTVGCMYVCLYVCII